MPINFAPGDYVNLDVGAQTAFNFADMTIAAIVRVSTAGDLEFLGTTNTGGTYLAGFGITVSSGLLYYYEDTAAGFTESAFTVTTGDDWTLIAMSKASGSATPRFHKYVFSTGVWTHSAGTAAAGNATAIGASGHFYTGAFSTGTHQCQALATYSTILSDAQVESLASSLAAWLTSGPASLWIFDQATTSMLVRDWVGTSHEDTRDGAPTVSTLSGILGYGHAILETQVISGAATPISLSDTGSGTDALTVAVAAGLGPDAGSGTDTLAVSTVAPVSDTGTGSDSLAVSTAIGMGDAATAVDSLTVVVSVPLTEVGAGTDALTVDTGGGTASKALDDVGSGSDSLALGVAVPLGETGNGTDALAVAATATATDTGTGADGMAVGVSAPLADAATGVDTLTARAAVGMAETLSVVEGLSIRVTVPLADTAVGTDSLTRDGGATIAIVGRRATARGDVERVTGRGTNQRTSSRHDGVRTTRLPD